MKKFLLLIALVMFLTGVVSSQNTEATVKFPKGKVKIALLQHSCSTKPVENLEKVKKMIRQAAKEQGAKIICLQELFKSTYFAQEINVNAYDLAEPIPCPTTNELAPLAKELGVVLIVPLYEYAMDGVYFNSCAVIDADGTYMGKTRKMHIPEGPQYIEKFYFTPGDLGYKVYKTKFAVIGIGICWDEWFPELSRILALKGAQILFFPSAIGSEPDNPDLDTSEPWRIAVRANGVVNNVFVGCVNRVGEEKGLYIGATDRNTNRKQPEQMTFYGRSFISGPFGEMLAEAKTKNDEIITAECDLSLIKKSRDILQFHRDRRPETYKELLKIVIEE